MLLESVGLIRLNLRPAGTVPMCATAMTTPAVVVVPDRAALPPEPAVPAAPDHVAARAEPRPLHEPAMAAPPVHGLLELERVQALAQVRILVLEELLHLLRAQVPHAGQEARDLRQLQLPVVVRVHAQEDLIALCLTFGLRQRLLLLRSCLRPAGTVPMCATAMTTPAVVVVPDGAALPPEPAVPATPDHGAARAEPRSLHVRAMAA